MTMVDWFGSLNTGLKMVSWDGLVQFRFASLARDGRAG